MCDRRVGAGQCPAEGLNPTFPIRSISIHKKSLLFCLQSIRSQSHISYQVYFNKMKNRIWYNLVMLMSQSHISYQVYFNPRYYLQEDGNRGLCLNPTFPIRSISMGKI